MVNLDEFVRWKPKPAPTDQAAGSGVTRRVELTEPDPTKRREEPAAEAASVPPEEEAESRKKIGIVTVVDEDGIVAIVPDKKRNVVPETVLSQRLIHAEDFYNHVMNEEKPEELRMFENR